MTMPVVGSIAKVSGISREIAASAPMPGMAPIAVPTKTPAKQASRFCGSRATERPRAKFSIVRSEEHTSELQSLMRISYAVFCLKKNRKAQSAKRWEEHKAEHQTQMLNS